MKPDWTNPDGTIQLYNADCRDVLPTLATGSVALFVTSPPYNQLASLPETGTGLWGKTAGGAGFLRAWSENGYADEMDESAYIRWQNDLFAEASRVATDNGSLFYNHQCRWRDGECLHPVQWFRPEGWNLRQEIVWDRGGGMMFNARMFVRFDERVLWMVRGKSWKWNQSSVGHGTIWRIARQQQQQGKHHPVEYPIELPLRCILAATDPGDLICDPFMGGGTTCIAAIQTERRFVGCERDPKHYQAAKDRITAELSRAPLFTPPAPNQTTMFEDVKP